MQPFDLIITSTKPRVPPKNYLRYYNKADGMYFEDHDGNETSLVDSVADAIGEVAVPANTATIDRVPIGLEANAGKIDISWIPNLDSVYAAAAVGVTGGNNHAHALDGHGAQISHLHLSNIGTKTHAQIDSFIATKGANSGLASLDSNGLVNENPKYATATPTAERIPISDEAGHLATGWLDIGDAKNQVLALDDNANLQLPNTFINLGGTNTNFPLEIQDTGYALASGPYTQLLLHDTASAATNVGGGVTFSCTVSGTQRGLASIQGCKEDNSSSTYAGVLRFFTRVGAGNQYERMRITSTGFLGIGLTSNITNAITLKNENSTAGIGMGYSWNQYSSRRWKSQIELLDYNTCLQQVLDLKPSSFIYMNDTNRTIGFIAEEVHEIIPELVTMEDDGENAVGMDYSKITTILAGAVHSLASKNQELEARLKKLEDKMGL